MVWSLWDSCYICIYTTSSIFYKYMKTLIYFFEVNTITRVTKQLHWTIFIYRFVHTSDRSLSRLNCFLFVISWPFMDYYAVCVLLNVKGRTVIRSNNYVICFLVESCLISHRSTSSCKLAMDVFFSMHLSVCFYCTSVLQLFLIFLL